MGGFTEERWKAGVAAQEEIADFVEAKWSVKRTAEKNNIWDFWSPETVIELKSRRDILPDKYDTWVFDEKKIVNCSKDVRRSVLLYYFPADRSLFYINYEPVLFADFKRERNWPEHTNNILIPRTSWTKIDWT